MYCQQCGSQNADGAAFCEHCGARLAAEQVNRQAPPTYQPVQPVVIRQETITEETLPERYRPLGAWAYFGYSLLFSLPIAGFICLIVFSLSDSNINRRNFARSYWCVLVLALIIIAIVMIVTYVTVGSVFAFHSCR